MSSSALSLRDRIEFDVLDVNREEEEEEVEEEEEEEEEGEEAEAGECFLARNCSLTRVAKTGSRATCLASCTYDGSGTVRGGMGKIATTGVGGGDDASYGECERWCFHWNLLLGQCLCFLRPADLCCVCPVHVFVCF